MQLTLFQATRSAPSWEAVPIELQQQVVHLLARMLREHLARPARGTVQGGRDE
jgi:hypothetical protein